MHLSRPNRGAVLPLAIVLVVLAAVPATALGWRHRPEPAGGQVVPLPRAHAHNDYEHRRPLLDALDHGFTSVEADIHLVDGELLVAHDAEDVQPGRTLERLYLDPLADRVRANRGSVYGDGEPFQLLIDVKTEAAPTYEALHRELRRHAKVLTTVVGGKVRPGAVTAVVSGNRDLDLMASQRWRAAFYDGRLDDLGSDVPASLIPLISDRWTSHFTWVGRGPMPEDERAELHDIVTRVHAAGQRVRFWATPDAATPAREAVWRELVAAGVDHINTDDLAGLEAFLRRHDPEVPDDEVDPLLEAFRRTSRSTDWQRVAAIELSFDAFHTQGMTRVGDHWYISSVEITEPTERYPEPVDGYDRSPGAGVGHLFKVDDEGNLVDDLVLGEGIVYHPGGIDFDGTSIWVPVAEYRPHSSSIVYRVDPEAMTAEEAFRVSDHIGGVVADPTDRSLSGVSWGSRTFYRWNERGALHSTAPNESHVVDYQDCEYVADATALCGGVANLGVDGDSFPLGGLALVDLDAMTVGHEIPVLARSDVGRSITQNPVHLEAIEGGLRLTAVPDDDEDATIYVYETSLD